MKEIYTITLENTLASDDARLVKKGLADFNWRKCGVADSRELDVFLKDSRERTVGGLLGFTFGENAKGKGKGSRLLKNAVNEAVKRGCKVADVATFAFQAPEFYRKNGYEMFGELENAVGGESVYYFRKKLQ